MGYFIKSILTRRYTYTNIYIRRLIYNIGKYRGYHYTCFVKRSRLSHFIRLFLIALCVLSNG